MTLNLTVNKSYCTDRENRLKVVSFLVLLLSLPAASARVHKCVVNGNTTYQQTQCINIEEQFIAPKDISLEQQAAATEKRIANLATIAEEKKAKLKANETARGLHLEAEKINAIKLQTQAITQQTTVLKEQNNQLKKNVDNTYLDLPLQRLPHIPSQNDRHSPSTTYLPVPKRSISQEHSLNLPRHTQIPKRPLSPTKNHLIKPE